MISRNWLVALGGILLGGAFASGGETPGVAGWRGDGTGRYSAAQPPTTWSKDSGNIVWQVDPGRGFSSPVLWKGHDGSARLFLTAQPAELLCIDPDTGNVMWQQTVDYHAAFGQAKAAEITATHQQFEAELQQFRKAQETLKKSHPNSPELEEIEQQRKAVEERRQKYEREYPSERRGAAGNAAATVVCDHQRVYAVFGTGLVAAFTVDGKRVWIRHLEAPLLGFGHSASPALGGGRLIVHIQQLHGLDPESGETVWQVAVPAKAGSPVVTRIAGEDVAITPSGALVTAKDGRLLAEKQFDLSENSPLVHSGVLYAHESGQVKAFRLPETADTPTKLELLWESSGGREQRMASALCHDGLLFAGGRNGIIDVFDAATGELAYRKRLSIGELFSSPTLAGGLVFFSGRDGRTLVLRPGREYDEVAINELDRVSTIPVFDGRRMYVRGEKQLYCVEAK